VASSSLRCSKKRGSAVAILPDRAVSRDESVLARHLGDESLVLVRPRDVLVVSSFLRT